ncbi:TrkA C-terminal domain-containing protein [Clostridium sp. A1-XYC3]|uniref:TrkA C-terminal domain-containing protein n=1 Tax=Clostridium tanneri TaxID=3037988 RepID=A0ABU4JNN3_9CLOT|nr:TrkA C-terminal domain-containing protein [Clostridium sp. A1-XYC3]MDW8799728.1 TrkA C-terminal domain-containing protein [Clostridium sp. A1-XYC3]
MTHEPIIKPVYQQIAIDIANKIISGDFQIGTKLHGRSSLAGYYNVSPETIRRAVILLSDMNIVEVAKGSGIIVKSIDNSLKFIDKFRDIESISSLKKEISDLIAEKQEKENKLEILINNLIDYSNRFKNSNPFIPFEFEINKNSRLLGKTISEIKFWQNTGGTIIGIRRNNNLILSPGPYATFNAGDIFIVIGDENTYERIKKFLKE